MDSAPSMVHRNGDTLIVRRVVSGDQVVLDQKGRDHSVQSDSGLDLSSNRRGGEGARIDDSKHSDNQSFPQYPLPLAALPPEFIAALTLGGFGKFGQNHRAEERQVEYEQQDQSGDKSDSESNLPQCKIKRNYSCNNCSFFTQNPRKFLVHLRDKHGEKIVINECKHCLYASRHYQKLVRHMKMVHGSTEGINEPGHFRRREKRRRMSAETRVKSNHLPLYPQASKNNAPDLSTLNQMFQFQNQLQLLQQAQMLQQQQQQAQQQQMQESQSQQDVMSDDEMDASVTLSPNGTKIFKCTVCEFSSVEESHLMQHEKDEHADITFYRCEKCSYVTHIKARFSKHVKYHSMPMIKCMLCDFRTPYKWNLDRHMKNHGGNGPFKCSVCNFTADIKQSLTVHEMNHHIPPLANSMDIERTIDDTPPENLNIFDMNNDSSNNSKEADTRSNPSPHGGAKRKKPMPQLIPIKLGGASSSTGGANKSDSDANHESSGAEENAADSDMQQYKIISALLQKPELSVESVHKSGVSSSNDSFIRKTGTFFDDIRKKLIEQKLGGNSDKNLVCKCGYEAKTLSDIIIHQKMCIDDKSTLASGSTRCQFCRIRFKSVQEVASHMQKCPEAQNLVESNDSSSEQNGGKDMEDYMSDEAAIDNPNERHPMENRVFIWNKPKTEPSDTTNEGTSDRNDDSDDNNLVVNEDDDLPETPTLTDSEYLGVESAPGYGEITKKIDPSDEVSNTAMKKVFKCPHCSFWASTASRFHVHIVGHLNKKPFECSLCAYRSNWRWDITKHIRLKLLRDPQHAEAKVLMNDETGRRNYSKYNKYITLMRVVDKKHDGKHHKSGLSGLNYSPKSSLVLENNLQSPPSSASTPLSVYSEPAMNLASTSATSPIDPTVLLQHLSKDVNFLKNMQNFNLLAQNILQQQQIQQQNEAQDQADKSKDTENAKKTHFKCKKCNFKHADREVVLEHVKSHYRDDGTPQEKQATSSTNMTGGNHSQMDLAPPPLPIQMPFQIMNNLLNGHGTSSTTNTPSSSSTTNVHNRNILTTLGGGVVNQMQATSNSNATTSLQTLNFNPQNTLTTPTTSSDVGNKNNNGLTDMNSSSSSLKGSFRCGHCGQISNWKHVIQRHCRLKHNGDIRIEVGGPKGEKTSPQLQQQQHRIMNPAHFLLQSTPTSSTIQLQQSNVVDNGFKPIILPPRLAPALSIINPNVTTIMSPTNSDQNPQLVDYQNKEISLDSLLKVEIATGDDQDKNDNEMPSSSMFVPHQQHHILNVDPSLLSQFGQKAKRYRCEMCPYETDSKSQFQYHSSFHKPSRNESYQCKYCSYNVSKRHLLNQHMKMHAAHDDSSDMQPGVSSSMEQCQENIANIGEKFIHYCSKCPARYLSMKEIVAHLKRHETLSNYKCDYCSFSSPDDQDVKAHSAVHTSYYQDKTKEFMAKYKPAGDYPSPQLYTAKHVYDDSGAKDDVFVVKDAVVDDHSAKASSCHEQENKSSLKEDNKNDEKCLYCPFSTTSLEVLKNHLQYHKSINGQVRAHKCEHCDFTCETSERIREHNKLHFSLLTNGSRNLNIYTSFHGLELNASKINSSNSNDANNNVNGEKLVYKEKDVMTLDDSSNERPDKVIIDV